MGGPTALACCVGTIIAGVVGSLVYRWNGGNFLRPYKAAFLMLLYSGFDMFLITVLTPQPDGIIIANTLYAPMTFGAVLGILLFTMFLGEKKEESEISDELKQMINDDTDKIIEISQELDEYKDKVDKLERELNDIKNKL